MYRSNGLQPGLSQCQLRLAQHANSPHCRRHSHDNSTVEWGEGSRVQSEGSVSLVSHPAENRCSALTYIQPHPYPPSSLPYTLHVVGKNCSNNEDRQLQWQSRRERERGGSPLSLDSCVHQVFMVSFSSLLQAGKRSKDNATSVPKCNRRGWCYHGRTKSRPSSSLQMRAHNGVFYGSLDCCGNLSQDP